ncbi:hypothetical protein, conserved [Eimeria praecox]|uniref:DEAD-box RNA helicase Q domain-containing protein n=1 Tax=Eimeria praecox TaxID=51316 RepID=U6H9A4_9EIME|nr:hypothetical protein, conserved [Eimeria praecox]
MKGEKEKNRKKRRPVAEKAKLKHEKKAASSQSLPHAEDDPVDNNEVHDTPEETPTQESGAPMDVTTEKEVSVAPEKDTEETKTDAGAPGGFFSEVLFETLDICDPVKNALKEMKMEKLTEIQAKAIPRLLEGKDVLGAAKTG